MTVSTYRNIVGNRGKSPTYTHLTSLKSSIKHHISDWKETREIILISVLVTAACGLVEYALKQLPGNKPSPALNLYIVKPETVTLEEDDPEVCKCPGCLAESTE